MKTEKHSGNSATSKVKRNGESIFRKEFDSSRSKFYFNEIFINYYLRGLDKKYAAKIIRKDDKKYCLEYEFHREAPTTSESARRYLRLMQKIRESSLTSKNKLQVYASQPFINVEEFSNSFLERVEGLVFMKKKESKVWNHLISVRNFHLDLANKLSFAVPSTPVAFSHADSGLHNCLISTEGNIMLADLEYAGLDSPIKQYFDYLLHPKTQ